MSVCVCVYRYVVLNKKVKKKKKTEPVFIITTNFNETSLVLDKHGKWLLLIIVVKVHSVVMKSH